MQQHPANQLFSQPVHFNKDLYYDKNLYLSGEKTYVKTDYTVFIQ